MRKLIFGLSSTIIGFSILMPISTHAASHELKQDSHSHLNSKIPLINYNYSQALEEKNFYRAYFPNESLARKAMITFHNDLQSMDFENGFIVLKLNQEEVQKLQSFGFKVTKDLEYIEERKARLEKQLSKTLNAETSVLLNETIRSIPGYSCYQTVEETFAEAEAIATNNPNIAEWIDAGDSWEKSVGQGGYDIYVLKLTNNQLTGDKPKLLINSAIHAREYTTAPLTLAFANSLVDGYGVDPDITWILDHHEVHLMLHSNPDGRKQAETGLFWRKNTNQNYCGATSIDRGADLNRNFSFFWNITGGTGSSGFECDSTYRGPSAGSEPETQALENYARSLYPDLRGENDTDASPEDTSGIHIDIHSFSELVLWPWGHRSETAPNGLAMQTLGRKFAYFNNYYPQQSVGLYPTDGTTDDVSYGELGIAAFTFELGTSFFQSCSVYENTILPDNLPALTFAAKVVRTPFITPAGPDSLNVAINGSAISVSIVEGDSGTITATANDTRFNNVNGSEATQNIVQAEYYIDTPPWEEGAISNALTASDGNLNSTIEELTGTINTTGLAPGRHIVFVRSQDASNVWGPVSSIFLDVISNNGNQAPNASFTNSCVELICTFDASASTDPDGTIENYAWDFGDGTSDSGSIVSHTFASSGDYSVTLVVTDDQNAQAQSTQSINVTDSSEPITGGFTETNLSPSTGELLSYTLNVPDNASSLEIETSGGTGNVDMVVKYGSSPSRFDNDCIHTGAGNNHTCSFDNPSAGDWFIVVRGAAASSGVRLDAYWTAPGSSSNFEPVADYSFSANNLAVTFTDLSSDSDGSITSWNWDFGDGNSSSLQNPLYTYDSAGTYQVTLTVSDDKGATDSLTQSITVSGSQTSTGGFTETNLSPSVGELLSYTIDVPANASNLEVSTSGGTGNVDLVIRYSTAPTRFDNDCIQTGAGNSHTCSINNPSEGTWFIVVRGAAASSGVQLDAYWTQ